MGEGEKGEEGGLRRGKRIVCFWKRGLVKKKSVCERCIRGGCAS